MTPNGVEFQDLVEEDSWVARDTAQLHIKFNVETFLHMWTTYNHDFHLHRALRSAMRAC